jgi:O-antigen/teichoic acid export membrane protein
MKKFPFLAVDNFLFVFGSFLINMYAARILSVQDFATFTFVFAVFNFLQLIGISFVFEQVMRLNSLTKKSNTAILFTHLGLSNFLFIIFLVVVFHQVAEIKNPIIVSIWLIVGSNYFLIRKYNHLTGGYVFGSICSILYLCILICVYLIIKKIEYSSSYEQIFVCMTIAAFLVSLLYAYLIFTDYKSRQINEKNYFYYDIIKNGFSVFGTGLITLFITNLYILIGSAINDEYLVASVRMLFLTILPINHISSIIITYAIIPMRSLASQGSYRALQNYSLKLFLLIAVFLLLSAGIIVYFYEALMSILYQKDFQEEFSKLTVFLLVVLSILHIPLTLYLRVNQRQVEVMLSSVTSCVVLLVFLYLQNLITTDVMLQAYVVFHAVYLGIIIWRFVKCSIHLKLRSHSNAES